MLTLFFISGSLVCVLLCRSLATLLRQIPDRNEDFNAFHGWEELGRRIDIHCFADEPNIKSSLGFLRKASGARMPVEELYLETRNH